MYCLLKISIKIKNEKKRRPALTEINKLSAIEFYILTGNELSICLQVIWQSKIRQFK